MWSVRQAEQEKASFDFRRAPPDNKTLTKLKVQRKQERREYDMANFYEENRMFPRFSDQPHPWWTLQKRGSSAPPKHNTMRPVASEPTFKITDSPRGELNKPMTAPLESVYPPIEGDRVQKSHNQQKWHDGAQTVKRWTTELIEKGNIRNCPRFFDNLKPITGCAKDFEPLENTSSIEPIRTAALLKQENERKHHRSRSVSSKLFPGTLGTSEGGTFPSTESAQGQAERSGRASVVHSAASSQQRGLDVSNSSNNRATSIGSRGRQTGQGNQTFMRPPNPLSVDTSLLERAVLKSQGTMGNVHSVQDLAQGATQGMYQASQAQLSQNRTSFSRQSADALRPSTVSHVDGEIVAGFGVRTGGFQRVNQIAKAQEEHRRAAANVGTV